jgi:hypothetical protein
MRVFSFALLLSISLGFITSSCDLAKQASQLLNLARCKYKLTNLSNLTLAGVNLEGKSLTNGFTLTETATLGLAFLSGALPLSMNLNVDIRNEQTEPAALTQMDYILALDGTQLTTGSFPRVFTVAPNTTGTLPIPINIDLNQVLAGQSQTALLNLALTLAGQSQNPTDIGLRIRPYFSINGQAIQFPRYFTVTTAFGGDSL